MRADISHRPSLKETMVSARILLIPALWLAGLLGLALPVAADPVADLYAADVAVTDQSAGTRASALKDALAQVLVKVTGSQAVLETAEAAALLENPSRYLQQFRYEAVSPVPLDPAAPRLMLRTEFDGAALERRLRAAGLPLWGRERPLTLAWVAFSNDAQRQLLGANSNAPVIDALRRSAARRGIPFRLPAMDTEDATRVSFMDVWGVFEDPLLAASERYGVDAVLAGSIFKAGDELWAGRWTLLSDGERHRFELSGPSPEIVAVQAIDALAEHYASRFAVYAPIGGEGRAVMEVHGVNGLVPYANVQSYLEGLSMVNDLRLLAVNGDMLRVELDITGGVRTLEQAIALGRTLAPLPQETMVPLGALTTTDNPSTDNPSAGPGEPVNAPPPSPERILRYRYRTASGR